MRKIINVRRNRNDTVMFIVIHDAPRKRYEVWMTGPAVDSEDVIMVRDGVFPYTGPMNENEEVGARLQAKQRARDLSDGA